LGDIISKSGKLTEGNKTYIQKCWIENKYNIQSDIQSKYFDKGIACEQDGLMLFKEVFYPNKLVLKNRKHYSNDFIQGTPDVIVNHMLADIKNAYDIFTFAKASLTWDYEWQLKGYMYLIGLTESVLFYCLVDMPDFLLAKEEKDLFYKGNFLTTESPDYLEAVTELRKTFIYDYMAKDERFKTFNVELTDQDIEQIEDSVIISRKYMDSLESEYKERIEFNKNLLTPKELQLC
jgi:hypothetical protein